jgi:hypothetical protein
VFGTDRYAGYLPDGTDYVVYLDTSEHEEVTAIEADLMYEDSSGGVWWVGPVRFRGQVAQDRPGMGEGHYLVPIGDSWTAVVDISPDFVELLGDDMVAALDSGISEAEFRADARRPGFPGLDLRSPFRWATSHDPLGPMEVSYETFSVQPGCDDDAAACTWTGFLQVRPRQGYGSEAAEIDSLLLRPESDPNYLDPGPYGTRHGADVFWTGTNMVIWGGQSAGGAWQSGGASFDPGTNVWKTFDGPVIPEGQPSRAAWTNTGMVVVTAGATFRGDPGTDVWEEIVEGIEPPAEPHQIIGVGESVFAWTNGEITELTASGWQPMPGLQFPEGERWLLALRSWDGDLLVSLLPGERCDRHDYVTWVDDEWQPLPDVSLATDQWADCTLASQVAVVAGEVIVWDDDKHPSKRFDEDSSQWVEIETIPMAGWDSPPGGVVMGDRLLVPSNGPGAMYDSKSGSWQNVTLPGYGYDTQMVWTGEEVLAFGAAHNDAWRWTPPG